MRVCRPGASPGRGRLSVGLATNSWDRIVRPTPTDIRAARHALADVLRGHDLADLEPTASLLVGELLTNVVLHSRTDAVVAVTWTGTTLRIEVGDDDPTLPVLRDPLPMSPSGRGLRIVAATAARWGVQAQPFGKIVWCELDRGDAFVDRDGRMP